MKTNPNGTPFNGSIYDFDINTSKYFKDGYLVAQMDFDNDVFEELDFIDDKEVDEIYNDMVNEKIIFEAMGYYNVKSEQGLFGYGY